MAGGNVEMRVAITGATGLVGRALVDELRTLGHQVLRLVRRRTGAADEVLWDIAQRTVEVERLAGVDGVVHLAGESIDGRWNRRKKERIRRSRLEGTHLLATALATLEPRPEVLVSASAIGYYGDRGAELLDESSPPGEGFLADVCVEWELAAAPAREAGLRVVHPRIGLVLSAEGGALARMLLPFRCGLGGRIGDGQQFMSWITIDDLVAALRHLLVTPTAHGPINAVVGSPVTNAAFTRTLGQALGRPTVLPLPAGIAKLAFGEMANELLLSSIRVSGAGLVASGFTPADTELTAALWRLLRPSAGA